ncbi:hypothetical protein MBLNU459_g7807t1 [Dothideomycetes sp. NU459]
MDDSLHKITTNTRRTWDSDASSGSSTAIRYNLDEEDTSPILAYIYGGDISTTSQKDLCDLLDNDTKKCRVTQKPIPRFASNIEVKRHDLYLPYEREEYSKYPNYDSSLASIRLPPNVYWGRLIMGSYENLFIVSPETSPDNSEAGSQHSPSFASSSQDAEAGAQRQQ